MSKVTRRLFAAAFLVAPLLVIGCKADTTGLATLTVGELAALIAEGGSSVAVYDANTSDVREKHGVIPGAVLLSNARDFDVAKELSSDPGGKLVFYCYSEMCSAGPMAARKALESGLENVYVLPAGITGWTDAGQPVEKAPLG